MALTLPKFKQDGTGAVNRDFDEKLRESVSVLDFGTVGMGDAANDTQALILAFSYVSTPVGGATAGYTGTNGVRTLHIPAGNYLINAPIAIPAYVDVDCDKKAMFTAAPGYSGVLFYSTTPYQIRWSGGIFQASANGVGGIWWVGNANYPTSPINLDQGFCIFENFEAKGFQDVFPVLVNRSAQMTIRDFKADRNVHLIGRGTNLNTTTGAYSQSLPVLGYGGYADAILIQNGWITMSDLMDTDFDGVICADIISMRNLLLVPVPHTGVECAWVNAWSYLTADNVRYGGESGAIIPCNWMGAFSDTYPIQQTGVVIKKSFIYGADSTSTTLAADISNVDTTIVLTDGSKLPTQGEIFIGGERINFFNRVGNTLSAPYRSNIGIAHLAGANVVYRTSSIIRLFFDLPNFISITGCSGGADISSFINYWYGMGTGFTKLQNNAKSAAFKCVIKDNNLESMLGDFGYVITHNVSTSIDRDRSGCFHHSSITAGSPGLIRTVISSISCVRAKTYRLTATLYSGAGNYQQSLEGVLSINKYFDGAAIVMQGNFTKTADIDPTISGAPDNLDVIAVKFQYTNGVVTAGNTVPFSDADTVNVILDVSASIGGVSSGGYAIWKLT
jgi:hypothetical protein